MHQTTTPSTPGILDGSAGLLEPAFANSERASAKEERRPAVSSRRSRVKAFIHLLRRSHLYTGLFMLPWVVLYGITAFLFNHPDAFADRRPDLSFGPAEMEGTPLQQLPSAAELADQVVGVLNAQGKGTYRLVQPEKARFERGLTANVSGADGTQYVVVLQPSREGRVIRLRQDQGGESRAPFAVRGGVTLEQPPTRRLEEGLPAVLTKVGLAGASVTEVRPSPLAFLMEGDGQLWQVSYNAQSGSVSGKPANEASSGPAMSSRQFLLRLHLAHRYPGEMNVRWLWAVVVDVMAGVMVFWALTGLVMWWQIKATRWLGAAVLVGSLVAAGWIGLGMHHLLAGR